MKDKIIEDYKKTIERLQQECTEKTDMITKMGQELQEKKQRIIDLEERLKEDIKKSCDFSTIYYDFAKKAIKEAQKYKQATDIIKNICNELDSVYPLDSEAMKIIDEMIKTNKFVQYEAEKIELQNTCKSSQEYEEKIKELIKKLKL